LAQGVGVRYNANGIRVLKVDDSDEGMKVTGIAAGLPGESLSSFTEDNGFSIEGSTVVFGLGPGDFLTSSVKREEGMDDSEIQDHLRWEIEKKIISDISEYNFDFAIIGDTGFVFAGRKKLINEMIKTESKVITDVEPVALFNGCEGAGEIGDGTIMFISVEAEGISSVVVEGGMPSAMESFIVREDEISSVLPGLNQEGISKVNDSVVERLSDYVFESIKRLTSLGENNENPIPERVVLAGGGVYTGELAVTIEKKSGIATAISDPFASSINDVKDIHPEFAGMSAAFTTCFGLAIRAMEI